MIGKTNVVSGGKITIPSVSNLNVNEDGDLTFYEPDYNKLAEYDPTFSYIVNINGTSFETTSNDVNLLHLLIEGENTVSVTVKAIIRHFSGDTSEDVMFSIPKDTDPIFFTLETTTVDNVNGYKITAYNGTDTKIIIPQYNTDGLPILELNKIAVPKINGNYIKKLNDFSENTTIREINLPETTNESFKQMFSGCSNLSKVNINTSKATNINAMFHRCASLTTIPLLDTSKATDTRFLFGYCSSLISVPLLDTSKSTSMFNMFTNCESLTTIPQLDSSSATSMGSMFSFCTSLTTIPQLDTSSVTNMSYMFDHCYLLTSIPLLDTSKVTNMSNMFNYCSSITEIPSFDVSNVTSFSDSFYRCSKLSAIHMTGMKASFNISASTLFTTEALHEIIDNLATVSTSTTLTMGSTNLAKVSQEYVAKATNKGWTLA